MDELERRIRAVRPLSGNRDLPLSDRAKRELAELVMTAGEGDAAPAEGRPRRWFLSRPALAAIAASTVTLAIVAVWSSIPAPVHAVTPPMLDFEPIDESPSELLHGLAERTCEARPEPNDPSAATVIVAHGWYLGTYIGADDTIISSEISPVIDTITVWPDETIDVESAAGTPADGGAAPTVDLGEPGTPLSSIRIGPEESNLQYTGDFPDDAGGVAAFLEADWGDVAVVDGGSAFQTLDYLLSERIPTCDENALLLQFLATLPDIDVAGATSDRLGRDAVALVTEVTHRDYLEYLLLDPRNGRILAHEQVYTGSDRSDLLSPAVVSYTAWE